MTFIAAHQKDIHQLWTHLRNSAKKRNIEFNITVADLDDLTFPITCPIFGMPLVFNRGNVEDNSYSIDRIDSSKGYIRDNLVVISQKANRIKTNATIEELEKIINFYKELQKQDN
jgi:hypothetical protein